MGPRAVSWVALLVCLLAASALVAQEPPQAGLEQAYALLRADRLEEARAVLEQILSREPENRTARLELAYLNGRLGRWKDAAQHFNVVAEREPENLRLRMDYGYALEKTGALDQAAREFQFVADQPGELQAQARAALEAVHAQQGVMAREKTARRDAFLNRGYARLREGDRIAARYEFEQARSEDPTNVTVLKQLGYLALEEGRTALAAQMFAAAREHSPEDATIALQLGYLYDRLGQPENAEEAFQSASGSSDAQTQQSARTALATLRANRPSRMYLDVFAAPLYSTRFDNAIVQFQAQLHWRPRPNWPATFYLGTRITHDSRSRGGSLPAIFSDNVALLGAGVSFRPRKTNLTLVAEANLAFNLTSHAARNRKVEPDFRAALYYYRRWDARLYGPAGLLTLGRARSERLFTDLDASLGYYSRYADNVIGYLQLREGLRVAQWGPSRLYGYGKVNLAKDTNRDFYNNLAEFGAGAELRPHANTNLSLRVEYLRGIYYGIEGKDRNPYGSQYYDVRVTLLFGRRFRIR